MTGYHYQTQNGCLPGKGGGFSIANNLGGSKSSSWQYCNGWKPHLRRGASTRLGGAPLGSSPAYFWSKKATFSEIQRKFLIFE